MSQFSTTFSHDEISLLLFALQGGSASAPNSDSCEQACPVVESVEDLLCGGGLDREQQLIRHLNNHLREALIECGVFEVMAESQNRDESLSSQQQAKLGLANRRLKQWSSEIKLTLDERRRLFDALREMPRSAWLTMPRLLLRLRRKLKAQ